MNTDYLKEKLENEILFNQMVSHDLRNILCNMTMLVGILSRVAKGQPQVEKISEQIRESISRMDRVISQLLEMGKIKAGKINPVPTVFSATDLAKYIEIFEPLAKSKGVSIEFKFPPNILLKADKDLTGQVLDNLISNAIKFTPSGGKIEVWCEQGNPHTSVHVKDSGPGIPTEDLPHLFERYWQKSQRTGSLGLGLSICKTFVEENGGEIGVSSQIGVGTTFTFTIPSVHQ